MSSNLETFYQDHWIEVDEERHQAYELMFQWHDGLAPLIAPAEVEEGQTVLDYGCGPGHLAMELARRVGPSGQVWALDINREFLERTRSRAADEGLDDRVNTKLVEGEQLPVPDASMDRVICKNVLEYVPDPEATVREFRRVLRPGGLAHVADSDWGSLIVEPLEAGRLAALMRAAAVAFKTPLIGRRLYGIFRRAGFQEVRLQILADPDTQGFLKTVILNMASYARASGRIADSEIDAVLSDLDHAIQEESFLGVLPQFLATGEA